MPLDKNNFSKRVGNVLRKAICIKIPSLKAKWQFIDVAGMYVSAVIKYQRAFAAAVKFRKSGILVPVSSLLTELDRIMKMHIDLW